MVDRERISCLDYVKGILIIFVVLGHVMPEDNTVHSWIYLFMAYAGIFYFEWNAPFIYELCKETIVVCGGGNISRDKETNYSIL